MDIDKTILKNLCNRIDTYGEEAIKIEKALTAIQALSPENGGVGESEKAEFIQKYLTEELGCKTIEHYNAPDDRVPSGVRPNIAARLKGKNVEKTIWIMSHMDVVPPGDLSKWTNDPWTIRVEDGKIFGRGTEDNQQGIVSSLLTAKAFVEENHLPEYDLGLLFVSDEETGNGYGIEYILKNHSDLFTNEDFIIIPDSGNEAGTIVEVAEKGILWIRFEVIGKQTHGSTPELGINAARASAHLVTSLDQLYDKFNVNDPVFDPPISTFEPTQKEANVPNVNTIPGQDIFYYDCRILPSYDLSEVKSFVQQVTREIETKQKVEIKISYPQEFAAAPPTPTDAPVVISLLKAISEIKNVKPKAMGIGGGTVAAFFREANFNAVVWATQDETLHGPDEYVKIDNILDDAKVFAHVALQK